jgi:hypothetical protein
MFRHPSSPTRFDPWPGSPESSAPYDPPSLAEQIGMSAQQVREYNALRDRMRQVSTKIRDKYEPKITPILRKYQMEILRLGTKNDPASVVRRELLRKKMSDELAPIEKAVSKEMAPYQRETEDKLKKIFTPEQLAKLKTLLADAAKAKED